MPINNLNRCLIRVPVFNKRGMLHNAPRHATGITRPYLDRDAVLADADLAVLIAAARDRAVHLRAILAGTDDDGGCGGEGRGG
jgi:hypothetical protein